MLFGPSGLYAKSKEADGFLFEENYCEVCKQIQKVC